MSAIPVSVSPSGAGNEKAYQDTLLRRLSCLFDSFMINSNSRFCLNKVCDNKFVTEPVTEATDI
jgi:hypothetical protein